MFDHIQNIWLFAAGLAAGFSALLHIFLGGREIAVPLLQAQDIPDLPKFVNYYCWHLVSITLIAMSVGLIWPALDPTQTGLAWMWTVIAVLFCAWSVGLVIWKRQSPWQMPQWSLFAVIALLGAVGLA